MKKLASVVWVAVVIILLAAQLVVSLINEPEQIVIFREEPVSTVWGEGVYIEYAIDGRTYGVTLTGEDYHAARQQYIAYLETLGALTWMGARP